MKQLSAKIKREIARREKIWKKATPAQKRVLIAEDVIENLQSGRARAQEGVWLFHRDLMDPSTDCNIGVRELFLSPKSPHCSVCAIGGIMLSCTLYANNVKVKDAHEFDAFGNHFRDRRRFRNGILKVFSRDQLRLIEAAFEAEGHLGEIHLEGRFKAEDFRLKHGDRTLRLIAIMRNIIKNNGQFKP